jgi:hypothetical protein
MTTGEIAIVVGEVVTTALWCSVAAIINRRIELVQQRLDIHIDLIHIIRKRLPGSPTSGSGTESEG